VRSRNPADSLAFRAVWGVRVVSTVRPQGSPASPPPDYKGNFGLAAHGVREQNRDGHVSVRLSYINREGIEVAARYLVREAAGTLGRSWRTDSEPTFYQLEAIALGELRGEIVLAANEEDTLRLLTAGIPAVGIPEGARWQDHWAEALSGVPRIVLLVPGEAPDWTIDSPLAASVVLVRVDDRTLAALRHTGTPNFQQGWSELRAGATPWREVQREALAARAGHLIAAPDVLTKLRENGLSQHRCGQVWGESGTWSSCGR